VKASELKELIRIVVAEEVKKQLPSVLSEMYLKRIVSENVSVKQPQVSGKKSLVETLELEEERPVPAPKNAAPQMTREQLRAKFKSTIADPEVNPMAALYEGTVPVDETAQMDGVSLDQIPGMRDFSAFVQPQTSNTRGPIKEPEDMVRRRLEEQRRKLDSIKVG
jgi:hypothetical protein